MFGAVLNIVWTNVIGNFFWLDYNLNLFIAEWVFPIQGNCLGGVDDNYDDPVPKHTVLLYSYGYILSRLLPILSYCVLCVINFPKINKTHNAQS